LEEIEFLVNIGTTLPSTSGVFFLMNALVLIVAGILVGYLIYLLWKILRDLWKSRNNLFSLIRFILAFSVLALIGYILYQNFDIGDLLTGLLWLFLGIFVLSALLAIVERMEQNFKPKKGGGKDNKTPSPNEAAPESLIYAGYLRLY
jgi:hypothetical protein